ncbi:MBL fold metallo-hydrolase [Haloarcula salinisoli]|uniref:MBL fold metallo-hydrolase n=1 Tax=Haloarcula salinisoli TaxID=2487746 RepID=UPI0022A79CB8|nr:MBL fold metallo-hydrolase [Halomicroarcula salinisoli]
MTVVPRGGAREVGRSCYHVMTADLDIIVDCGLKQGEGGQFPDLRDINQGQIDAVFLTHAHIDHSGGLPVLEHRGLLADDAPIITTRPTTALAHTLLHDSIKIHIEETERQGREQKFTRDDVHDVLERFTPKRHGEHKLSRDLRQLNSAEDITYRLGDAGHLLGSVWIYFEYNNRRLVISGDLGGRSAHLPDIEMPPRADTLLLESTYGARQQHRALKSARNQLYQDTLKAVKNDIPVLIPTFAVGRSQEVMQIFRERFPQESEEVQEQLEVVYDGMARDATAAYHAFSIGEFVNETVNNWRMNSQDQEPFLPDSAWYPEDTSERVPILDGENAPIIVAPSGMLTGGTSPVYLAALVEHYDEARIFFTGYQAENTPGRKIQQAAGDTVEVTLPVTPLPNSDIEATEEESIVVTIPTSWVQTISGFSGHCARQTLNEFVKDVDPKHVGLVHGPPEAQKECKNYFEGSLDAVTRAAIKTPIPVHGSSSGEIAAVEKDSGAAPSTTVQSKTETTQKPAEANGNSPAADREQKPSTDQKITKLENRIAELESAIAEIQTVDPLTEEDIREIVHQESKGLSGDNGDKELPVDDNGIGVLSDVDGIGPAAIDRLRQNGYDSMEQIKSASISELAEIEQFGTATAKKVKSAIQG